jgi:hypothetical protein
MFNIGRNINTFNILGKFSFIRLFIFLSRSSRTSIPPHNTHMPIIERPRSMSHPTQLTTISTMKHVTKSCCTWSLPQRSRRCGTKSCGIRCLSRGDLFYRYRHAYMKLRGELTSRHVRTTRSSTRCDPMVRGWVRKEGRWASHVCKSPRSTTW